MIYLIPIEACIFLIISRNKDRNIFNPFSSFNILWIFVGVLLCIGNELVYEPSTLSKWIIIVGIFAFNIASWTPRLKIWNRENKGHSYSINYSTLFVLSIIITVLSFVSAAVSLQDLVNGVSYSVIRNNYYTYESGNSTLVYYVRNFLIIPMTYVVIIGTAIVFFTDRKIRKLQIVCLALIVILQALTSGGRYILMNTFFVFACAYFIYKKEKNVKLSRKILIALFVGILFYGIVYLTNERATYATRDMTVSQRLYLTVYEYFAGSVTYMGQVIDSYPFVVGSTYGVNFAAGFLTPIFTAFNFLHLITWPEIFNAIGRYACSILQIGPNSFYNAMPTVFGYFYIDGGFILLFVEAWLFGYICKRLYLHAIEGNIYFVAIYIMMFVQICTSSTRWLWYSADFCLAVLYMRLILNKKHINDNP